MNWTAIATFLVLVTSNAISGGEIVQPHEYPFAAYLVSDSGFNCGASLLSEEWAITAAHCLTNQTNVRIVVGDHDRHSALPKIIRGVKLKIIHPDYSVCCENDIALLWFDRVQLSNQIQFIKLADTIDYTHSSFALGWGAIGKDLPTSGQLRRVELRLRPINPDYNWIIAEPLKGGSASGICFGDSGGPLIQHGKLIGVASFGGCNPGGGFSHAPAYRDWAIETIRNTPKVLFIPVIKR